MTNGGAFNRALLSESISWHEFRFAMKKLGIPYNEREDRPNLEGWYLHIPGLSKLYKIDFTDDSFWIYLKADDFTPGDYNKLNDMATVKIIPQGEDSMHPPDDDDEFWEKIGQKRPGSDYYEDLCFRLDNIHGLVLISPDKKKKIKIEDLWKLEKYGDDLLGGHFSNN